MPRKNAEPTLRAPYGPLPEGGTVRPMTRWGTPVMHRPQQPVTVYDDALRSLAADMVATMYAADGVGLAACQIGEDVAMFVFDCPDDEGERWVGLVCNPVVTLPEGKDRRLDDDDEGCLSFPGAFVECPRPDWARVDGFGLDGEPVLVRGRGPAGALPAARDRPHPRHGLRRPHLHQGSQEAAEGAGQDRSRLPAGLAGRRDGRRRVSAPQRVTTRNARFQQWEAQLTNRTKRHRLGEFVVQGVRPITLAVEHGWRVRTLLHDGRSQTSSWADDLWETLDAERFFVAPELLAELGGKEESPELVAVVEMPEDDLERLADRARHGPVVVFDRPTNPGNIGTLARSADAFGAAGLVVTGHAADPYDPRCVRASTGSLFSLAVVRAPGHAPVVEWAQEHGYRIVGTDETGTVDLDAATSPAGSCWSSATRRTGSARAGSRRATRW